MKGGFIMSNYSLENVIDYILTKMKETEISQRELARRLGVSPNTVANYLNKKSQDIPSSILFKICDYYHTTPNDVSGGVLNSKEKERKELEHCIQTEKEFLRKFVVKESEEDFEDDLFFLKKHLNKLLNKIEDYNKK